LNLIIIYLEILRENTENAPVEVHSNAVVTVGFEVNTTQYSTA
jgi:hypothetical protein